MIDIENYVFTQVKDAVLTEFPNAEVNSSIVEKPSKFPCVTFIEADNFTYIPSLDDSLTEHHANLMYECNVYANDKNRKATAKAITEIVDNIMQSMKFTRTYKNAIPNQDRSIFRITLRYKGIVEMGVEATEEGITTTVHQMYRN